MIKLLNIRLVAKVSHLFSGKTTLSQEKIKNALQEFGLTGKEADTYILLAKIGPMKGTDISKQMKRNKGQVYRLLKVLQNKGLVESTIETPTRFVAVSFETALDMFAKVKRDEAQLIEEKTKDLIDDWKKISKKKIDHPLEKFAVINGKRKNLQKISEMIRDAKRQFYGVLTFQELMQIEQMGFFDVNFGDKAKSKVNFCFLTDVNDQNVEVIRPAIANIMQKGITVKGRNPDFGLKLSPRMIIKDKEEMLFSLEPKNKTSEIKGSDVSLGTNCQSLIQSFESIFEELWQNSTYIIERISEIDSTLATIKKSILDDSETIKQKFERVILSAENEIIMMIRSGSLTNLCENKKLLQKLSKNNVRIKIMMPITTNNLEFSIQLSKIAEVRHVHHNNSEAFIVDKKHFLQFKTPLLDQKEFSSSGQSVGTFYSDNLTYVNRMYDVLSQVWKTAVPPSTLTLESIIGSTSIRSNLSFPPLNKVKNIAVISKNPKSSENTISGNLSKPSQAKTKDLSNKLELYSNTATAIIYPPKKIGIPDLLIMVDCMQERSTYGKGNSMMVYLKVKLPEGHFFIPAGGIGDNPQDVELRKKLQFSTNDARKNFRLVKKDQMQVRVQNDSFLASWAVPITLNPNFTLPPAYLLLEGYGDTKKGTNTVLTPTGFTLELESIYSNAFVTFIHPASRYSGPGTDGIFFKEVKALTTPPE